MLTFIALTVRILINPLSNVFQKQLVNGRNNPLFVNFLTYLSISILSILYAAETEWQHFQGDFWISAVLVGVLGALGNGFLILSLEYGELSVLGPVNSYKSVVSMAGALLFLGESPGLAGCAGIAFIILGSYYVLDSAKERFTPAIFKRKDIQYRAGAMILTATEAVFIKKIILLSSPEISLVVWCWSGALFSFLFLILSRGTALKEQFRIAAPNFMKYCYLIICVGLMQLSTNYSFNAIPVAYALALFQLSSLISVFFGTHFFKEESLYRKLLGAGIMALGSLIIIFKT
jgi:drug/metabolite transporter (DMT)-like permease